MSAAEDFERMPPHDIAAEQATLGGMMFSATAVADVDEVLRPGDHYRPAHKVIHEVILSLFAHGSPTDPVAVAAELMRRGDLAKAGGAPYLHTLQASVPAAAQAGYYAGIVRERAILRRLIEAGNRIVQLGYEGAGDAAELVERARQEIEAASPEGPASALPSMDELTCEVLREIRDGTDRGLPMPWADLDTVLNGLVPGRVYFVAARPRMGKSIFGAQAAQHVAAKLGRPVLLASMEMRAKEIAARLLSARSQVPLFGMMTRDLSDADWAALLDAADPVGKSRLMIDDTPRMSLARIRARLREMARSDPAALLVVDYLGLLEAPKAENRQNAVAEMSRELKLIAGEFGIPVVCLAQLNRGPDMRSDHRPTMADLRDSGSQEQDADVVILLYREDAYEPVSPRAGEIDVIVSKNRHGPEATVTLAFQGHYGRMEDMARI